MYSLFVTNNLFILTNVPQDVSNKGNWMQSMWELSVLFSQFVCKSKSVQKISLKKFKQY